MLAWAVFILSDSFRWRDAGVVTIETMCHDPTQPLYGVMLEDFSSLDCLLKSRFISGQDLRLCACTGDVCNEDVFLSKPPTTNHVTCECVWSSNYYRGLQIIWSNSVLKPLFLSLSVVLVEEDKKPYKLVQLCKFCDIQSTTCNDTGICESSCNISAVCESPHEVCVGSWYDLFLTVCSFSAQEIYVRCGAQITSLFLDILSSLRQLCDFTVMRELVELFF